MHSATERQETGEKMKDEGKENPHKRAHCLPTMFIQSFRASTWLPVAVAMVFAHFINEGIHQRRTKQSRSAVISGTNRNLG